MKKEIELPKSPKFKDKRGLRIGRLIVKEYYGKGKFNQVQWLCECDCGNDVVVDVGNLRIGHTESCGCLKLDTLMGHIKRHGMRKSSEYRVWCGIIQRCTNPKSKSYKDYGGRGIKICSRWMEPDGLGFSNFYADMGERPKNTSIDRIDVNGDYTPQNCRWAELSLQGFNQRKRSTNVSGRTGVSKHKNGGWTARISKNNEEIYLGYYKTFEEAVKAREEAELKYFGFIKENTIDL